MRKTTTKGKIYVRTSKGLVPFMLLQKAAKDTVSSKQLRESHKWMSTHGLIEPPYPPDVLLELYESNPIFWRCVNQLASDVAGLGWNLVLKEGQQANKSEYSRLETFLNKPNPHEALRVVLKNLLIDWGSIGWFALEVVRNQAGEIAQIYHVPAHTIRVHSSQDKYCQKRNNKIVWFKRFGSEQEISAKDGSPRIGKKGQDLANELIFVKNFYSKSTYYGMPNILAAVGDVIGLIGCRDYNLAFFQNYGVPSSIIILEGDWDEGSEKAITDFLDTEIKGSENAHRTLVATQPSGCKFTYVPLGTKTAEGSFRLYEQTRRDDILTAYSMPPERVGIRITGSLGGNVAEEATKVYVQGVVEPLQMDLEDIFNNMLFQSLVYDFKFENIDLRDYAAQIEMMIKQISHAILTPNEARHELGYEPYPEGDKFYIASTLIEIGGPAEPLFKGEVELFDDLENEQIE